MEKTPIRQARKIVLPTFVLTEVCEESDEGAIAIPLPDGTMEKTYYTRPKQHEEHGKRVDGKPRWVPSRFNMYPVVLDATGQLWPEANIYILSRLEDTVGPVMSTYTGIAEDLAAYRRFLDDEPGIDWLTFPPRKLSRPTYRYNGHLIQDVKAGEIADSSAKRRMSSVIAFYNWLIKEKLITPEHLPWVAKDVLVELTGMHGFKYTKKVTTTDISIHVSKQENPYDGKIEDGGKLRPLPEEEQHWLLEAVRSRRNTEMTLIYFMALLTGARIQTILTFRVHHVFADISSNITSELRLPVGPGTGIDTKNDKLMSLHLPIELYQKLRTYAHSDRARHRRELAPGGDVPDQYLFLSIHGSPLYRSKEDSRVFDPTNKLRHAKAGQTVRQFIRNCIIPYIRTKYDVPQFHFQFHDTRATFGMNLTDDQINLVAKGETTLNQAREFVKSRMGHDSTTTTDRYLQFRGNIASVRRAEEEYGSHLRQLRHLVDEMDV